MTCETPCMGCKLRQIGCHAECSVYAEWQEDHIEKKRAEGKVRGLELTLDDVGRKARRRMALRKSRRKKC